MLRFFFKKPDPAVRALYDKAVAAARSPVLYQKFGVADTLDGRFDMVVFHISPLIDEMRDEAGAITPAGQALFDTFVHDMEQNLRTLGVGDTTVPKKMKRIGEAFYGRFDAYRKAADDGELAHAVARNALDDEARHDTPEARALTAYMRAIGAAARAGDPVADFAFPDAAAFAPEPAMGAA